LFREVDRIDIRNDITQNFGDVRTWSFGFNLDNPDVWHEEVGAVIRAKLLADGGHYSGRNARYDWLTLNHFADMSAGSVGVTLSNADCYFFRLGNSTTTALDTATPRLSALAGGQVDGINLGIQNQGGDAQFLQRFAISTHDAFSPVAAMRFALEHQNPLVTGIVTGNAGYPETSYSLLNLSNSNVMLWALKPAEEGIERGVVARLWNLSNSTEPFSLTLPGQTLASAKTLTHIETETGNATVAGGAVTGSLASQQMRTYLLKPGGQAIPTNTPTLAVPTQTPTRTSTQPSPQTPTRTATRTATRTSSGTPSSTRTPTRTPTSTNTTAPGVTATPTSGLFGDVNGDDTVETLDLLLLAKFWEGGDTVADLNFDLETNQRDLMAILDTWHQTR
jgi:hypothetical protein